jgi:acetyl/propionyl-CoA carboxylase alpha subunit
VKYEIVIDGKAVSLSANGERLQYQAGGGAVIERGYLAAPCGEARWSVLIEGRSYAVTLLGAGEVSVNGRVFQVEVFDPRSLRGRRTAAEGSGPQTVAALMPGRVIRVLVETGQDVEAGQGLVVVEAMKMQNEMKSPKAGTVIEIRTQAGATVAAGDVLLVIE